MPAPQIKALAVIFLFAFVLVFLTGWFRSRNPRFLKLLAWSTAISAGLTVLAVAALMALFFYATREICTDHYTQPLTVEEARRDNCPIPLPDSARHVQFAFAAGGLQALEILVRFEAPPDVCRRQVQVVCEQWARQQLSKKQLEAASSLPVNQFHASTYSLLMKRLGAKPQPLRKDMVPDRSWFDIEHINRGVTSDPGAYGNMQIWIDEDRGIFYYKLTD